MNTVNHMLLASSLMDAVAKEFSYKHIDIDVLGDMQPTKVINQPTESDVIIWAMNYYKSVRQELQEKVEAALELVQQKELPPYDVIALDNMFSELTELHADYPFLDATVLSIMEFDNDGLILVTYQMR